MRFRSALFLIGAATLLWSASLPAAALKPQTLRCEYRDNPIGMDSPRPRMSWTLAAAAGERGKSQSAYRVLVASSRENLARNIGDQWDSGKVVSGETLHVAYAGKAVVSNRQYFWKVSVWDEVGTASNWSAPAMWTSGLLSKSDWQAKWITDPDIMVPPEAEVAAIHGVNSGYHSTVVRDPNTPKWVGVDLGQPTAIDTVRLFPSSRYEFQEPSGTVSFPDRYRIEVANQADFSDAKTVADRTREDSPQPRVGGEPATFRFDPVSARYVRVYVTRLCSENELFSNFALAEMEVLSGGKNVALGKTVVALDSLEGLGYAKSFLTDGVLLPVRRKEIQQPATWMRKAFRLDAPVRRATAFITARGVYELHLNGRKIGDHILAPEWTSYLKRSQYQAYDVTDAVRQGDNVIGAVLSHAWYAGRVGLVPRRRLYGETPELLVHLDVELANGKHEVVVSDESWRRSKDGPILSADVYDGETFDARKEMPGWDAPGLNDSTWKPAVVSTTPDNAKLNWQSNEPILARRTLKPVKMTEPRPGIYIFDLGQNMVGRVRLKTSGPAGTTVRIRHAEVLSEGGELYTDNLRDAWQIDRYTLRGADEEVFEPHFTYHGFRYVELTGLKTPPGMDAVTGIVFYSSAPEVGEFATSNDFINKLHSNIVWTQRANMEGIPTDCPQRPERLGWTGDIQTYAQAAMFNMDMAQFLTKYLRDMRDDQDADGRFPDVAPDPFDVDPGAVPAFRENRLKGSPGWGDAGVILPWRMWVNYADKAIVAEQYDAAKAWVEYIRRNNPDLLWRNQRGLDPGDWLNGDTLIWPGWPREGASMPLDMHGTAFFAHSTDLVSRMAAVLGRDEDARHYRELFAQIKTAFNRAYVEPDGRMKGDTQGGYALALHFNLVPEALRTAVLQHMLANFQRYNGHLSTGFQSTHRLMLELTRAGRSNEGYRLLTMRGFPSWSLMIENGATTIWERWDGYVKGRGFQMPGMNSFNHYAFGAVEEWMWRNITGINPDEQHPGYKHFVIRPELGGDLTWARGSYDSIRGLISTAWKLDGSRLSLKLSVPPNTTATVYLPGSDVSQVREAGRPAASAPGVRVVGVHDAAIAVEVGSGDYEFVVDAIPSRKVAAGGR
jgi:alpha-L-rhamnosidase